MHLLPVLGCSQHRHCLGMSVGVLFLDTGICTVLGIGSLIYPIKDQRCLRLQEPSRLWAEARAVAYCKLERSWQPRELAGLFCTLLSEVGAEP